MNFQSLDHFLEKEKGWNFLGLIRGGL